MLDEGWRGRAETIVLLKSKCKRLESELESATGRRDPRVAARAHGNTTGVDVDRQARADLKDMEEERRRATEQLTRDYQGLEANQSKMKETLRMAKARTTVLENENAKFKKQMKGNVLAIIFDCKILNAIISSSNSF